MYKQVEMKGSIGTFTYQGEQHLLFIPADQVSSDGTKVALLVIKIPDGSYKMSRPPRQYHEDREGFVAHLKQVRDIYGYRIYWDNERQQ